MFLVVLGYCIYLDAIIVWHAISVLHIQSQYLSIFACLILDSSLPVWPCPLELSVACTFSYLLYLFLSFLFFSFSIPDDATSDLNLWKQAAPYVCVNGAFFSPLLLSLDTRPYLFEQVLKYLLVPKDKSICWYWCHIFLNKF